jgi:hypothetical protein
VKTTVDITDALLREAKRVANREGVTVRALIEEGLRHVLAHRGVDARPFKLRDASVGGKGLHPDADAADWARIRELAYRGRGG